MQDRILVDNGALRQLMTNNGKCVEYVSQFVCRMDIFSNFIFKFLWV